MSKLQLYRELKNIGNPDNIPYSRRSTLTRAYINRTIARIARRPLLQEILQPIELKAVPLNSKSSVEKKRITFVGEENLQARKYYANPTNLETYDTKEITSIVEEKLLHALTDGYTLDANVHVKIASGIDIGHQSTKSFDVFKIRNLNDFTKQLIAFNRNMTANNPNYTWDVSKIIIRVVKERAGGCNTSGKVKKTVYGDCLETKQRTGKSVNNCFFYEVHDHIGLPKGKAKNEIIEEMRREFNMTASQTIPISIALQIYDKYKGDKSPPLRITDDQTFIQYGSQDDNALVLKLRDNHYSTITLSERKQCPDCGRKYFNNHKCNLQMVKWADAKFRGKRSLLCSLNSKSSGGSYLTNNYTMHYDLETFPDKKTKEHTPYIVGVSYRGKYHTFSGDDCMSKFINYVFRTADILQEKEPKKKLYVNAFNGANFDHYFIYREFLNRGIKPKQDIINNGSIIKFDYKNISLFDVCKHLQGSLKSNLKSLDCKVQKGDFDHTKACRWEEMCQDLKIQCLRYLKADVLGLEELFNKVNTKVFNDYKVNITSYISTSALTFNMWKQNIKNKYIISLPTIEQEEAFRESVRGARTYPSKRRFISSQYQQYIDKSIDFDDVNDYLIDADVVSLYPAAMCNFKYPIGHPIESKIYQPDKLGIYEIKFTPPKTLQHSLSPVRSPTGLTWDLKKAQGWYTSVDIDMMTQEGYIIEFIQGYYWKESAFIYKEYIEELFTKKSNSKKGTAAYLLAKLWMNALYGKNIQRPIHETTQQIVDNVGYWKFYGTHKITDITKIDGKDIWFITGIPRERTKQEKNISKPTQLGSFILAYSRKIMLNYIKEANPYFNSTDEKKRIENDFYYTDTDSLQMHQSNAKNIKRLGDKSLGGITDDLGDGCKIISGYWIAPKLYMLEYIKKGCEKIHYHFRGKGLNAKELTKEKYLQMDQGKSMTNIRDFSMKKINFKRNRKQLNSKQFSIVHYSKDDPDTVSRLTRTVNNVRWAGRKFTCNNSIPWT